MIRRGAIVNRHQVPGKVSTEAHPGEEQDEADDEINRAAPIRLLLGEKISLIAHEAGLLSARPTEGTDRSPASSISQSSAGEALARPATRLVGNCICLVLY